MAEYITLLGAEDVLRAGRNIEGAAETISRAAMTFDSAAERLAQRMENAALRMEQAADRIAAGVSAVPAGPGEADCGMCKGKGFYGSPGARCEFCKGTGKVRFWRPAEPPTTGVAIPAPTGWLIYTHQRIDPYYWHGADFPSDEWNGYPIKRKAPVYEGALGVAEVGK